MSGEHTRISEDVIGKAGTPTQNARPKFQAREVAVMSDAKSELEDGGPYSPYRGDDQLFNRENLSMSSARDSIDRHIIRTEKFVNDMARPTGLAQAPKPMWSVSFGGKNGVDFYVMSAPRFAFQRWLLKVLLGMKWEKIDG